MKKRNLIITAMASICLLTGTGVAAINVMADKPATIVHLDNSRKYNENSAPIYGDNKNTDNNSLMFEKNILKKIDKNQIKTNKSSIKSCTLKTWGKHIAEDDPSDKNLSRLVDDNRKVYVVKTSYPDGIDTKAGFYANATLISVYDAQTGDLLKSKVVGDCKKNSFNR